MYVLQHSFVCRPSDSTVSHSQDARIEPRTVATLALAARRSNHSARSHPHSARSHQHLARSHPQLGQIYLVQPQFLLRYTPLQSNIRAFLLQRNPRKSHVNELTNLHHRGHAGAGYLSFPKRSRKTRIMAAVPAAQVKQVSAPAICQPTSNPRSPIRSTNSAQDKKINLIYSYISPITRTSRLNGHHKAAVKSGH